MGFWNQLFRFGLSGTKAPAEGVKCSSCKKGTLHLTVMRTSNHKQTGKYECSNSACTHFHQQCIKCESFYAPQQFYDQTLKTKFGAVCAACKQQAVPAP